MYKFLTKHGTGAAFGLGLLVTVIGLIVIIAGLQEYSLLPEAEQKESGIFNAALYGTLVLLIISVVAVIIFGIIELASYPKVALRFAIAIAGLILLGYLFYSLSEVETSGKVYEKIQEGELSGGVSKILNGALWTTLALAGIAVLGIIVSEIRNLFK